MIAVVGGIYPASATSTVGGAASPIIPANPGRFQTQTAQVNTCDTACAIAIPCVLGVFLIVIVLACLYSRYSQNHPHFFKTGDTPNGPSGDVLPNTYPSACDGENFKRSVSGEISGRSSLSTLKPGLEDVRGTRYSDVPSLAPPSTEKVGGGISGTSTPYRISAFIRRSSSLFPFTKPTAPENTNADPQKEGYIDLEAGAIEMKSGSVRASTIGNAQ
jgi:hypothetical protein